MLSALPRAAGAGVAIGVVSLALQAGFRPLVPEAARQSIEGVSIPSPWEGFLASISAGFNEEVWFRLGLMTLFVFLGAKLSRQGGRPAPAVIWTAIALVALLFAAVHLPQIAALAGSLPAPLVAFVLLTTGSGGVAFGWLYWKRDSLPRWWPISRRTSSSRWLRGGDGDVLVIPTPTTGEPPACAERGEGSGHKIAPTVGHAKAG